MQTFEQVFGFAPQVAGRANGRVNLLGEHTDYNDGFVLPTAIARQTTVHVGLSRDGRYQFHSAELGLAAAYHHGAQPGEGFARYIYGCIETLRERGHVFPPLCVFVSSEVPIGTGLSSSAALEIAMLRALRTLGNLPIDDVELARIGQQAEIHFAHVRCGIMDQMAVSLADRAHMLFLDTRTLERRLLPLPRDSEIVVLDSGVPRTLAATGYNERRAECEEAARLLGLRSLRDVADPSIVQELPQPLQRRARHVLSENERVLRAASGVSAHEFGVLMNASHASLRDDYEVSVPALDKLVAALQSHSCVLGARLTGAGFGGACVALVDAGKATKVKSEVLAEYACSFTGGSVLV